ncbi:unnamed protein product [Periconia digitata]|uniref:Uncharacterized protein n=1 Tax=Periconia digitata TaxID=1303443 RepID=A0A9W4UU17_9PLEO|nr:unnamed protein product [Periconia digitata]
MMMFDFRALSELSECYILLKLSPLWGSLDGSDDCVFCVYGLPFGNDRVQDIEFGCKLFCFFFLIVA